MNFVQTDRVRDSVLPVLKIEQTANDTVEYQGLLGSAFLIGQRGFIISASHVLRNGPSAVGFVENSGSWASVRVLEVEHHPDVDVAVAKVDATGLGSIVCLDPTEVHASTTYDAWGYPVDPLYELVDGGMVQQRPDLAFKSGHVRRRLRSVPLPTIRGDLFLELTVPAGSGFSGAPVVTRKGGAQWGATAVYVGERRSDDSAVGYAVPVERLLDWSPALVGRTVLQESADGYAPGSA